METRHIKLESSEAINSQRQILSTEINLLNLLKKFQSYKSLRNSELKKKALLKKEIKDLIEKIENFKKILPRARIPKKEEVEIGSMGRSTRAELERELKVIREKLARLS